jgi:hypothetical protein
VEYQTVQGPSNFVLKDIGVHGMAGQGVLGSHINKLGTDTFTASDIYLRGNGLAGWDSDGGGCGTSCETVGTMTLSYMRVEFNGCVQNGTTGGYNSITNTWANGYNWCYDDGTGGYGDGLSFIAAGDVNFTINNSYIRWNTQDCYDLLHLGDDQTHNQNIYVYNNWSEGCEGQSFKIGGNANVTAYNNVSIVNCRILLEPTVFPMTLNPAGYGDFGDPCRAGGDQWSIYVNDGKTISMIHNTSLGYSATMYDIGCSASCTGTDLLIFKDNISIGYPDPGNGGIVAAGIYLDAVTDPFANVGSSISYNDWYTMRGNTCPQDGNETNYQCTDPALLSESDINAIQPPLTAGSTNVIGKGITAGPTTDILGNAYANPPSIGAYEFLTNLLHSIFSGAASISGVVK